MKLRSFGSKCTILKKKLVTLLGLFGTPIVIQPQGIVPLLPPLIRPCYQHLFFVHQKIVEGLTWAIILIHDTLGKRTECTTIPKVVVNQDNHKVTNTANICNEFNKFLRLLHQKWLPLSNFRFDHYMSDINQCESFFLLPVCEKEIRNLIINLDTYKATELRMPCWLKY